MRKQIQEYFVPSASAILFVIAVVNLFRAMSSDYVYRLVLDQSDPVLILPYRLVFLLAGGLQLLLSVYLLMGRSLKAKMVLIAAFSFALLGYRLGFGWRGEANICNYVGSAGQFLVSPLVYDEIVSGFFGCLLLGSLGFFGWSWLARQKPTGVSLPGSPSALASECSIYPESAEYAPSFLVRFKRLLYGWGIGGALAGLLFASTLVRDKVTLPRNFGTMLEEISSVGELRKTPISNQQGTELVYLRNVKTNVGSFIWNLTTSKQSQPQLKDVREAVDITFFGSYGWSPDDRYMVYSWTHKANRRNQQMALCDGVTGALITSFEAPRSVRQVIWLTTNSLVWLDNSYTLYSYNLNSVTNLGEFGKQGMIKLQSIHSVPRYKEDGVFSLVKMSDHSVACVDKGNIWTLDIVADKARQLTHLTNKVLEWLDYCPSNDQFLFCLTDSSTAEFRRLYLFDPKASPSSNLILCSPHNTIFKGQWIYGGAGIAYIDTIGNKNCLVVDAKDRTLRTNLFLEGHVRNYSVAPDGQTLFAFASLDDGPMGIWKYSIVKQELRNVVPALERPFVASKITIPTKASVIGIGYFFLPPVKLEKNKKYPVVFDATRDSRWDPGAEILANAGIYYVSVNRDGMSSFYNYSTSPKDMLEVYHELLKNPNVDPHRIYVAGTSSGTSAVTDLVNQDPARWRGAVLMSPLSGPAFPAKKTNFPSLFVSIPELDDRKMMDEAFVSEAAQARIPVRVVYHPGQYHILESNESIKDRYEALVKFILLDE